MKAPIALLVLALTAAACQNTGAPSLSSIISPTATTTTTTPATTTTAGTTTTTTAGTTTTTLDPTLHPAAECQLPDTADMGNIGLGFPRNSDRIPSTGTVKATVLFADFFDVPATMTPGEVFAMISPGAEQFFATVSYGRLDLLLEPHLEWLRLSQASTVYGEAIFTFEDQKDQIQEAMDLADAEVDFGGDDLVVVIDTPNAETIPFGPTYTGFPGPEGALVADGAQIINGVTSGVDLLFWGFLWLNHEMGHSLGLVDLYSYDGLPGFTGEFSLMDDIAGAAPGYLAYERWLLDWLDDDQIVCQKAADRTTTLTAIETEGGVKAVIVPIDVSKALVVESRRAIGYDVFLTRPGALVYTVDTAIESGLGPIVVENGQHTLRVGESVTVDGITVTVVEATEAGDMVRVTVADPAA